MSAGTLALGADYLAHALFAIPLLPEQAGYLLLKLLPLSTFANLLKALGVLARPLLLVGATVVIIAVYGVASMLIARVFPRRHVLILTAATALVSAIVATVAFSPSDSPLGAVVEVVLLAGMVPLVDRVVRGLATSGPFSEDRRILMRNVFYGAVGIALLGIGYANVRRFATALAMKEGSRTPTEITPVGDFYVVSKNIGGDPVVDGSTWRLNLPGRSLTYDELLALPSHDLELTLECISNEIGGTLISNGSWKGPRVSDVLALTSVPSNTTWMLMESADGYTESFQLRDLTPDHLLATHLNGSPLTSMQSIQFGGIAFAGSRRVSGVELSWDGGRSWQPADLQAEFSPYAWRFWQLSTSIPAGHYNVKVRARDGEGTLQPSQSAPTLPNGADGYHTITLDLA